MPKDCGTARAQSEPQRNFLGAVGCAGREQAAKVRARRQQNQPGEQHQSGHERARRSAQKIAAKPGPSEAQLHAVIVCGIGLREPRGERVQVRGGRSWSDARFQVADNPTPVSASILKIVCAHHRGLLNR